MLGKRYHPFWYSSQLQGLSQTEQIQLFEQTGVDISADFNSQSYIERIGKAYEGHPLALRVIAGEIVGDRFDGNVIAYWNSFGHEIEEVEKAQQQAEAEGANDQFRLDRYTRNLYRAVRKRLDVTFDRLQQDMPNAYLLICYSAVFRHPVPEISWLSSLEYDCTEEEQEIALDILRERYLVEEEIINNHLMLRQHNLIRSIALDRLRKLEVEESLS